MSGREYQGTLSREQYGTVGKAVVAQLAGRYCGKLPFPMDGSVSVRASMLEKLQKRTGASLLGRIHSARTRDYSNVGVDMLYDSKAPDVLGLRKATLALLEDADTPEAGFQELGHAVMDAYAQYQDRQNPNFHPGLFESRFEAVLSRRGYMPTSSMKVVETLSSVRRAEEAEAEKACNRRM